MALLCQQIFSCYEKQYERRCPAERISFSFPFPDTFTLLYKSLPVRWSVTNLWWSHMRNCPSPLLRDWYYRLYNLILQNTSIYRSHIWPICLSDGQSVGRAIMKFSSEGSYNQIAKPNSTRLRLSSTVNQGGLGLVLIGTRDREDRQNVSSGSSLASRFTPLVPIDNLGLTACHCLNFHCIAPPYWLFNLVALTYRWISGFWIHPRISIWGLVRWSVGNTFFFEPRK